MPRLAPATKTRKKPPVDAADVDPSRAVRSIRWLGAINLIFVIVTVAAIWWGTRAAEPLRVNTPAEVDNQSVTVAMEARLTSTGNAPIRDGDTVTDPVVVVHGVLADYGRLRDGLDGLSVTVRGTRVDILPETGEFTEKVILSPGKNQIDFGVWWNGREWQQQHVDVTYNKPAGAMDQPSL